MRVLVAIDGSECSAQAVDSLLERVWADGTVFRLITVIEPTFYMYGVPGGYVEPVVEAERELADYCRNLCADKAARIKKALPRCEVSTEVLKGLVAESIIDEAVQWAADLIVLGSHGRTGVKRFLLGSVAEKVASHAPCSVEIIKHRQPAGPAKGSALARTSSQASD